MCKRNRAQDPAQERVRQAAGSRRFPRQLRTVLGACDGTGPAGKPGARSMNNHTPSPKRGMPIPPPEDSALIEITTILCRRQEAMRDAERADRLRCDAAGREDVTSHQDGGDPVPGADWRMAEQDPACGAQKPCSATGGLRPRSAVRVWRTGSCCRRTNTRLRTQRRAGRLSGCRQRRGRR